ncbi:hypothetical protein Trydic_g11543 [Trypoxylus dichotomus]
METIAKMQLKSNEKEQNIKQGIGNVLIAKQKITPAKCAIKEEEKKEEVCQVTKEEDAVDDSLELSFIIELKMKEVKCR